MKRVILVACVVLGSAVHAQQTNPVRYTWIATSCATWNCAASALVLANGDKYVIALPTGRDESPWLVLKRVEEGSIFIPPEEPYGCQTFANVTEATAAFTAMDSCHAPLMLNVSDGRAVVLSLNKCPQGTSKRRATR